jgi:thermitase
MHRYTKLFAIAAVVLLTGLWIQPDRALSQSPAQNPGTSAPITSGAPAFAPDRILVKTKEAAPAEAVETINRKNKAYTKKKLPRTRVKVVKLPKELLVEEAVKRYEASPNIDYAEPDYEIHPAEVLPTPNDPRYPEIYGLNNTGTHGGLVDADVDAPEAWGVTTGDASTVVAVIDTGVDVKHPDLKNNIWVNEDEVPDNGVDDDGNGYVDDVNGWDFFNDDNSVFDSADDDRHGTHVAGTIAAEGNNDVGITGINWQAKVIPLKFVGSEHGFVSGAIEALNYAVANGATISNNSYVEPYSRAFYDAIKAAGTKGHLFVAAAGNEARDNDATARYPSSYDLPNIIAVAATDNKDSLASFSNFGSTTVDLAAPGTSVLSTLPTGWPRTYGLGNGTSMATPHVAGVATLVKSNSPYLDADGIKDRILSSVDPKPDLAGKTVTGGRLNAAKAVGANTAPVIDGSPPSRTRERTPTLSATVHDDETDLTESNISLYVDGLQVTTFTYDQAAERLTYTSARLSRDRHTIEVVAEDAEGASTTKSWSFRVVRYASRELVKPYAKKLLPLGKELLPGCTR